MTTIEEVDDTVSGSDGLSTYEDALEGQTGDRRHADALLDISEEFFLKELEPYDYPCSSDWEEAVSIRTSSENPYNALRNSQSDTFRVCTTADSKCNFSQFGIQIIYYTFKRKWLRQTFFFIH